MSVQYYRDTLSYDLWHRKDLYTYFAAILTDQVKLKPDVIEINKVKFCLTKDGGKERFVYFLSWLNKINLSTLQALSRSAKIRLRCDPGLADNYRDFITVLQIDFDFGHYLNTLLQVADNDELLDTFASILMIRQGLDAKFYHKDDKLNQGRSDTAAVDQLNETLSNLRKVSLTENKHQPINDHFDAEDNTKQNKWLNDRLHDAINSVNKAVTNDFNITSQNTNNSLTNGTDRSAIKPDVSQSATNSSNNNATDSENPLTSDDPFGQTNSNTKTTPFVNTSTEPSAATSQPYVESSMANNSEGQAISVPLNATENSSFGLSQASQAATLPDSTSDTTDAFDSVINQLGNDTGKDQDESQVHEHPTNATQTPATNYNDDLAQNNQEALNSVSQNEDGDIIDDSPISNSNDDYSTNLEQKLNRFAGAVQPTANNNLDHQRQFQAQMQQEDNRLAEMIKNI